MDVYKRAEEDYKNVHGFRLVYDRWEKGTPHHQMSERLVRFLAKHDMDDYEDCFCWKVGGDGDNGETLMYEMDAFFEMLDICKEDI